EPLTNPTGFAFPFQLVPTQGAPATPARPVAEAQVDELRRRFAATHAGPTDLRYGDVVREKRGVGMVTLDVRDTLPLLLWRPLDRTDPIDLDIIRAGLHNCVDRFDCLVGMIHTGGTVEFRAHCLAYLEPWVIEPK